MTETRVRVPQGDVVQRVYSVADSGGITVVEVENESTLPVAIAFDRRDLLTERPIGETPVVGIDLGADAFVLPLGHKASLRVGIGHTESDGRLPTVASAGDVVKGWVATAQRAGSFILPESGVSLVDRVFAARCDLLLEGIPTESPDGFLLGLDQVNRMGGAVPGQLSASMLEVAEAVSELGPDTGWIRAAALAAADRILWSAREQRARRDLARMWNPDDGELPPVAVPQPDRSDLDIIAWLERRCVSNQHLLPAGIPADWRGHPLECRDLPSSTGSTVSFALRWHGERPAVLWEQHGPAVTLRAPSLDPEWSSDEIAGEALWQAASLG